MAKKMLNSDIHPKSVDIVYICPQNGSHVKLYDQEVEVLVSESGHDEYDAIIEAEAVVFVKNCSSCSKEHTIMLARG